MRTRRPIFIFFLILVLAMVSLAFFLGNGRPDDTAALVPIGTGAVPTTMSVLLFAYDARLDTDSSGNVLCSDRGLVPLSREIPATETPLRDTLALLFNDPLTGDERGRGLATEFPLEGVALGDVSVDGDEAVIEIVDPDNRTSGGSCRVSILRAQIEATAASFGVTEVRFSPEGVLEP